MNERCIILILGTLPGIKSLEKQEYYGNDNNCFWRIMMMLLHGNCEWEYSRRLRWVLKHRITLWDVYESGLRAGSADATIKNPKLNNFEAFFKIYPQVKHVLCNGRPAWYAFRDYFGHLRENIHYLPSTSPALARSLEWKLESWRILKRFNQ